MCDQQRLRSACAYAQSDQSLCSSLEYSMNAKLLTEHHLEFISLKGGCTGSYESTLVKMTHCWKSHATAQLLFMVRDIKIMRFLAHLIDCHDPGRTVTREPDTHSGSFNNAVYF